MIPHIPDIGTAGKAFKAAGAVVVGGIGAVVAQNSFPDIGVVSNIGIFAVLAALLFRYVFRLLEDYRKDLATARQRGDALEDDLRRAGRASSCKDDTVRELTEYAHRLRVFLIASGADVEELPVEPQITGDDTDTH